MRRIRVFHECTLLVPQRFCQVHGASAWESWGIIVSFPRSTVLGCVPTIRVEPSPVSVAKTRQRIFGLTYYGCVQECVHTSNVEYHETCRVKSLDAACFIFVSRDPWSSMTNVVLLWEMNVERSIPLVKDHQAMYDTSHCEHRNRDYIVW